MKIYTCIDHEGMWVGVASVIVAKNEERARGLLIEELAKQGLHDDGNFTLVEIDKNKPQAIVLQNGDY